jgi:hypothetical protein
MIASTPCRRRSRSSRDPRCTGFSNATESGRLPSIEGPPPRRQFRAYPLGYFHIDLGEVWTEEGELYLFVAIDRVTFSQSAELHQPCPVDATIAGDTERDIEVFRLGSREFTYDSPTLSGVVFEETPSGRRPLMGARVLYSSIGLELDSTRAKRFAATTRKNIELEQLRATVREGEGRDLVPSRYWMPGLHFKTALQTHPLWLLAVKMISRQWVSSRLAGTHSRIDVQRLGD